MDCHYLPSSHSSRDRLSDLVAEHLDHLHYLNDILCLNIDALNEVLTDHLLNRLLIPLYVYSLTKRKKYAPRVVRYLTLFLAILSLLYRSMAVGKWAKHNVNLFQQVLSISSWGLVLTWHFEGCNTTFWPGSLHRICSKVLNIGQHFINNITHAINKWQMVSWPNAWVRTWCSLRYNNIRTRPSLKNFTEAKCQFQMIYVQFQ